MTFEKHGSTVYMTEQESERIRATIKESLRRCSDLTGHVRQPRDSKAAISQATGASLVTDMEIMTMTKAQGDTLPILVVGKPYPPCAVSLDDLRPMKMTNLRVETHHRDRQLTVKRVSPVVTLSARSWTMVQDEDGETERLEVVLHRTRHGVDVLESASTFTVKEPYFTLTEEGEPTLRIDHPSDLITHPNQPNHLPPNPTPGEASQAALAHKQKGNAALQAHNLPLAHAHYTAGLAITTHGPSPDPVPIARDLARNRAHVNLLLAQLDAAKSDALAALLTPPEMKHSPSAAELNSKAYFRAGAAAYRLGQFDEAHAFFAKQLALTPDANGAEGHVARARARLRERDEGSYDFAAARADIERGAVDAASWVGNTAVGESPGKGRGLFATRKVAAGEVVLCEKAFCVVGGGREEAVDRAVTYDVRDGRIRVAPVGLERAVVERLRNNPSLIGEVMGLDGEWRGSDERAGSEFGTEAGAVDVFRVHDIVARNAFGVGSKNGNGGRGGEGVGLWIRAAYINHSCVPNTRREFVGDLMVVRATTDIAVGEEIVHSYDESGDYDARQKTLKTTWDFECGCALCVAESEDDPVVREKRRTLMKEADVFVESAGTPANGTLATAKARRLAKAIDKTYDEERYRGLPRLALRGIRAWLAR